MACIHAYTVVDIAAVGRGLDLVEEHRRQRAEHTADLRNP